MVEYNYIDFAGPVQLDSRFKKRRGIAAPVEKENKEEDSWVDVFRGVLYGYAGGTEEAQELLSPSYTPSMEKDPFLDQQLELLKSVNIPKEDRTREVFPEVVGGFTEEGLKREVEKLLDENKQITSIDDTSITDSIVVPTDQGGEDSTAKKVIEGLGGIMSKPDDDDDVAVDVQPTDPTQDLLDRIAIGEGAKPELLKAQEKHGIGTTQYDMVYGFGVYAVPSKPVSEMTMKELYDYQTALINATKGKVPGTDKGTSASGKYQVTRKSLFGSGTAEKPMKNSWADKLNLKADTVYTPELQEKIAMLALKEAGYNAFIKGNKTEKAFHDRIADIWASVAKASGQDKYDQGTHTVKADLEPMYALLKPIKRVKTNIPTSPRPMLRPDDFKVASN